MLGKRNAIPRLAIVSCRWPTRAFIVRAPMISPSLGGQFVRYSFRLAIYATQGSNHTNKKSKSCPTDCFIHIADDLGTSPERFVMRMSLLERESGPECTETANSTSNTGKTGRAGETSQSRFGNYSEMEVITLIEPRALTRDCLAYCLGSLHGHIVVPYASIETWLAADSHDSASVILMGITGEPGGPEIMKQIANVVHAAGISPVIILSDVQELEQIMDVLHLGVRGYIPTSLPLDVALEAIRLVKAGGTFVPASCLMAAKRFENFSRLKTTSAHGLFTARQAAVVEALRRGKANKTIAYELNMSESTVKVHVRNIMKKLRAKNRTEVVFLTNALLESSEHSRWAARPQGTTPVAGLG